MDQIEVLAGLHAMTLSASLLPVRCWLELEPLLLPLFYCESLCNTLLAQHMALTTLRTISAELIWGLQAIARLATANLTAVYAFAALLICVLLVIALVAFLASSATRAADRSAIKLADWLGGFARVAPQLRELVRKSLPIPGNLRIALAAVGLLAELTARFGVELI